MHVRKNHDGQNTLKSEPYEAETGSKDPGAVTGPLVGKSVRKGTTDGGARTSNFQVGCHVCCVGISRTREEKGYTAMLLGSKLSVVLLRMVMQDAFLGPVFAHAQQALKVQAATPVRGFADARDGQ